MLLEAEISAATKILPFFKNDYEIFLMLQILISLAGETLKL